MHFPHKLVVDLQSMPVEVGVLEDLRECYLAHMCPDF